jgi:hypothetical protein
MGVDLNMSGDVCDARGFKESSGYFVVPIVVPLVQIYV